MTPQDDHPDDTSLSAIVGERRHLLDVAFRLLGSSAESELAVDRCYAHWHRLTASERAAIPEPRVWLTREVSRLALDLLDSADTRRSQYPGEWLPEPVPHASAPSARIDVEDRITLDDSLNMLLMVTLESLAPAERVAFILHDVFGVSYDVIADVVGRSPDASRSLARHARQRIRSSRRDELPADRHDEIVLALWRACESGDEDAVAGLLHPDVTVLTDGGGKVRVPVEPVHGSRRSARLLVRLLATAPDMVATPQSVNGHAGLVFRRDDSVIGVLSLDARGDTVHDIWIVLNPEKLRRWNTP